MANIGTMSVQLVADVGKLVKGYEKGAKATKKFVSTAQNVLTGLAAGAAFNSITRAVLGTVDAIDTLGKTADRLGLTVEALQELEFVASQAGVEMRTMETALQRLARRSADAAQGMGPAVKAFEMLELNAEQIARMSVDKQFEAIAGALEGVANQNERIALAQKFFDSEGVKLLQTMSDGLSGIIAKRQEAREIGLFTSEDAMAAAALNDALDKMQRTLQRGLGQEVANNLDDLLLLVEILTQAVQLFVKAVAALPRIGRAAGETIGNILVPTKPGIGQTAFGTTRRIDAEARNRLLRDLDRRVSREGPSAPRKTQNDRRQTNALERIERNTRPQRDGFPQIRIGPANL